MGIVTSAYLTIKTKIGRSAAAVGGGEGADDRVSGVDRFIYRGRIMFSRGRPIVASFPILIEVLIDGQDVPVEGPAVVTISPTFKIVFLRGVPDTGATAVTNTEESYVPYE